VDFTFNVDALTIGKSGIISYGFRFGNHEQFEVIFLDWLFKMKKAAAGYANGSLLTGENG